MVKNVEVFVFTAYRSTTIWKWSLMVHSGGSLDDLTDKKSGNRAGIAHRISGRIHLGRSLRPVLNRASSRACSETRLHQKVMD